MAPQPARVAVTMMGTKAHGDTTTVAVSSRDTVYSVAQYYGVDVRALIDRNSLAPPYALKTGQRLSIPAPATVRVRPRDTLYSIARVYGADQAEMVKLNGLRPPYIVTSGQVLKLPSTSASPVAAPAVAAVANDAVMTDTLEPVPTGPAISGNQGVVTEEDLAPPTGATQAVALSPPSSPTAAATVLPTAKPKSPLGTGVPKFAWPVNGSTLSGYGPKAGGRHNDGLNIGAPLGTPVRAAAAGDVVYSGDQVAGFGNLILIRHSGGFSTAYAHLQNPLVKKGARVTSGQAIAQTGKSGNVGTPQLHFEIRKGTQAVNPKTYLP